MDETAKPEKLEVTTNRQQDAVDKLGLACERYENAIARTRRKRAIVAQDVADMDASIARWDHELSTARKRMELALKGQLPEEDLTATTDAATDAQVEADGLSTPQKTETGASELDRANGEHVDKSGVDGDGYDHGNGSAFARAAERTHAAHSNTAGRREV